VIGSLIIGAVLAALALAFVLGPLLIGSTSTRRAAGTDGDPRDSSGAASLDRSEGALSAIDVLREIEFDRATGKLSDADYGELKSTYTTRALTELRAPAARGATPRLPTPPTTPAAAVRATTCPDCGVRAPPGAVYCFNCARYLAGTCPACGGTVTLPAARYCSWCGVELRREAVPAVLRPGRWSSR
jgi:hypothetical protein